jgi:hypothetical protein
MSVLGVACTSDASSPLVGPADADAGNAAEDRESGVVDATPATSAVCNRYLACAATTAPATLPSLQEGYGPGGTCFKNAAVSFCDQACRKGLSQLRAAAQGAPACGCESDEECLEPGSSHCDAVTKLCGTCDRSKECGLNSACLRSPTKGTACGACTSGLPSPDTDACGVGITSGSTGLFSSAAPYCTMTAAGPKCIECLTSVDCGGAPCDTANGKCSSPPNCTGIWQCLRYAPVECKRGESCCGQERCSAIDPYIACMSQHCATCMRNSDCFDCSVAHCKNLFGACKASCM